jgi:signal transduction histidine kinase
MDHVLKELQDVATLQNGRPLQLARTPVDLVRLVHRIVEGQQAGAPTHRLIVETGLSTLVGAWDRARLARVLDNLLSNATKYSPQGGDVVVSIREKQEAGQAWAILEVRDRGIGISTRDLPHMFEWFRRGSNAAQVAPGTGLGLAGVREIVRQHGGRVRLASKQGAGTTVTVRLPLQRPDAHPTSG